MMGFARKFQDFLSEVGGRKLPSKGFRQFLFISEFVGLNHASRTCTVQTSCTDLRKGTARLMVCLSEVLGKMNRENPCGYSSSLNPEQQNETSLTT